VRALVVTVDEPGELEVCERGRLEVSSALALFQRGWGAHIVGIDMQPCGEIKTVSGRKLERARQTYMSASRQCSAAHFLPFKAIFLAKASCAPVPSGAPMKKAAASVRSL
jgi:hypothetical protein